LISIPKDFEYVTTTGRINRLRQYAIEVNADHDLNSHLEFIWVVGAG